MPTPTPKKLYFNRKTQRYHDSGRHYFLGREEVKQRFEEALAEAGDSIFSIADRLIAQEITVAEWEALTRAKLKTIRIWGYAIGAGGQKNLNADDYSKLGAEGNRQNQYLRQFAKDLKAGKLTENRFKSRLKLYVQDAEKLREVGRNRSYIKAGYTEEIRHRTKTDSCSECLAYAAYGWVPIGTLPDPGRDCSCKANCGCYKDFRRSGESILSIGHGWIGGGVSDSN